MKKIVCEDPPSVTWFEHPNEGYDSRDRSLWLFAARVSSTRACPMLSRHPSLRQSYLSVHPRCAAYISLESPPAGYTREYASCAHRETTLCASRESFVHHCLSLQAVLPSRLQDSTTAWSVKAFNTTSVVVVRGKTSRVPSVFLSCTAAQASPTHASKFCLQVFIRRAPVSASLAGKPTSAECLEASPPHLPRSSRAPNTPEPSRSLISSMSLARSTHHHVLELALLHPTAA